MKHAVSRTPRSPEPHVQRGVRVSGREAQGGQAMMANRGAGAGSPASHSLIAHDCLTDFLFLL